MVLKTPKVNHWNVIIGVGRLRVLGGGGGGGQGLEFGGGGQGGAKFPAGT